MKYPLSQYSGRWLIQAGILHWLRGEPLDEIIVLPTLQIIINGIACANDNIHPLKHPQFTMMTVSIGEGEDVLTFTLNIQ